MAMRWWYLRRAVPWTALAGCCTAGFVVAAGLHPWPAAAFVLLPVALGCCAAAAAFCFDEPAAAVVGVTPRGGRWSRVARGAVTAAPLLAWCVVVAARPDDLALSRPGWVLLGVATIGLTAGVAALLSRHGAATPGTSLATAAALAVLGGLVVTMLLGWQSIYPLATFPASITAFWTGAVAVAAVAWVGALAPAPRRPG